VALQVLTANELAHTPTVFSSFMGKAGARFKTVAELLGIYRERSAAFAGAHDEPSEHLRVERFMRDMAGDGWSDGVVMRIGVFDGKVLLIDGIHRAIAYLACVQDGVGSDRLPALHVDC
jgi:hypothetical protein